MELSLKTQKHNSRRPKLYLQLTVYEEGTGELYKIKKLPLNEALENLKEIIEIKTGEKI